MAFPHDPDDFTNLPSDEDWAGGTAAFLVIERGEARRAVRAIERPVYVIGGASDCDMILGDPQFSDYHAYIYVRGGIVTLRHLGPAPEMTINGRGIRWGELKHRDRLRFGPYQLQLRLRPALTPRSDEDLSGPTKSTVVHDFRWDGNVRSLTSNDRDSDGRLPEENRFTQYWQ